MIRRLKRRLALANPALTFDRLLFTKRVPTAYSHLVMQYFGWRVRPGGGIYVLESPGRSLACRDLLRGKLAGGNVLEPRLPYDAKRIVFSLVKCPKNRYDPGRIANDADEGFYHVYEVGSDGTGLRQLTRGPYDDVMPTYLPDGGIAFCSTRRRGYARCFGGQFSRRWHVYTLHRMDGDGKNLRSLSFHDTNEWFPAVSHSGQLLYSRWDYIDRDAVTHQNLWSIRPDGTSPATVWGNATPTPHCTFQIQPGERVSCIGCHENRMTAPPGRSLSPHRNNLCNSGWLWSSAASPQPHKFRRLAALDPGHPEPEFASLFMGEPLDRSLIAVRRPLRRPRQPPAEAPPTGP